MKWDRVLFEAMKFVDDQVARREAGWEPAPGCEACDEERSGVSRRGRPFNHSPECPTRQADFQEQLRDVKRQPADEA